jgi:hypothetical protein
MQENTILPFLVLGLMLASSAVPAQQPRYSSDWSNPDAPPVTATIPERPAALDTMIRELRQMTREAERHRAADPNFLADLKDLARRYSWPWKRLIVLDDFRDGDLTHNPSWTIRSGNFAIRRAGLVSTVESLERTRSGKPQPRHSDDVARQILGGLLQDLARERNNEPVYNRPRRARIALLQPIPNRFAIYLKMRARTSRGDAFELGVGQGKKALGYYLRFDAGASPGLSLVRRSSRGRAVIDTISGPLNLEEGKLHTLLITRDRGGNMTVALNGETRIRVRDRSFRDPFDQLMITNRGGRYAVRSVAIYGTPKGEKRRQR